MLLEGMTMKKVVAGAVVMVLMVIFWIIMTVIHLLNIRAGADNMTPVYTAFLMMPVLLLILLSVAPAKAISRRLIFLALGLLLLIALNELSKLGIDLTAPKVQG